MALSGIMSYVGLHCFLDLKWFSWWSSSKEKDALENVSVNWYAEKIQTKLWWL